VFAAVLIANRGEIAVRIIRTLRALGVRSIAVYSDADAGAPHVALADAAVRLGPAPAAQSYLAADRLIDAALTSGAQAVHPGYGFLSENAGFARECAAAGLVFIGPPPEAIEAMGDKIRAKTLAERAGVPVVPGVHLPGLDDAALIAASDRVGYPLLVKAAAGGGGRGMRIVREAAGLPEALRAARREAQAGFGDDALLLERYVQRPRHIEVQVLGDAHGNCLALGERECSLQRRYQKVVEEAPSPLLDAPVRERIAAAAVALAEAVGYRGAGTVEFVVPSDDPAAFAFLEMNTRLQVEHPVTEEVWGVDLVALQLRVAAGEPLDLDPAALRPRGHAVEARVYAEDPARGFLPTGGRVLALTLPSEARTDFGVAAGMTVGSDYDPMLGKVIAYGADRAEALERLDRALSKTHVLGVTTNVGFLRSLLAVPDVRAGDLETGLIDRVLPGLAPPGVPDEVIVVCALAELAALEPAPGALVDPFDLAGAWRVGGPGATVWRFTAGAGEAPVDVRAVGRAGAATVTIADREPRIAALEGPMPGRVRLRLDGAVSWWEVAQDRTTWWLGREGWTRSVRAEDVLAPPRAARDAVAAGPLRSPMPGMVSVVSVVEGDEVVAGQTLLVVEAMKMEHPIVAPIDGVVAKVLVRAGQQVPLDAELAVVEPAGGE